MRIVVKYYWYINLDPEKHPEAYNIGGYVKRSLTPPTKNYYYITESIDGYVHNIKGKMGEQISSVNDNGSPSTLTNIHSTIIEMLKNRYTMDREEIAEIESEKRKKEPSQHLNWLTTSSSPFDDAILLGDTLRRRKRIKARMNAKPPRYKREIVRKKKR